MAWSACDPFVFVSVSYDGRVVINHVPSTEKYKILCELPGLRLRVR